MFGELSLPPLNQSITVIDFIPAVIRESVSAGPANSASCGEGVREVRGCGEEGESGGGGGGSTWWGSSGTAGRSLEGTVSDPV